MTDYTLMQLVNWLEGLACKCFYSFERSFIKPRFMTQDKKQREYLQDSLFLVALCRALYKIILPYKEA